MAATKSCTNCGAENDLLLTNCLFCKSSLPQVDVNSISNEDLVLNAGEWVGKTGSEFVHMTENYNTWTGKGLISISANQIEGMAQRYLTLLQVRSLNNQNLQFAYNDLKSEFDNKRKGLLYKLGGGDKDKGQRYLIFIVLLLSFLMVPVIVGLIL